MLNDIAVKSAACKQKQYKISDSNGLYLLVKPNGGKYWRYKYYFNKKEKVLALGVYPNVKIKEARNKRDDARRLLDQGIDPSIKRAEEKLLSSTQTDETFEAIGKEWFEHAKEKWTTGHSRTISGRLDAYIYPQIGQIPLRDVTPQLVLACLRKIEAKGNIETTKRTKQYIDQIYRYAIATGRAENNPAANLNGALKPYKPQNYKALSINELPGFWNAIDRNEIRMYGVTQKAIKLMVYTFLRTGELIGAQWQEFDFENRLWVIPEERMKMRREHAVPLSRQVIRLLEELRPLNDRWVLPSPSKIQQHISNNAMLVAIKKLGYQDKTTVHGFRAMASTTMNELKMARPEVIEKQLAHEETNKVKAAYNRAEYLPERTQLMQDWADYVDSVCRGG